MGILSKTTIYVSSTVYNLAGDEEDRPNFLKNVIVGNVLFSSKLSMGEAINTAYLNGPGVQMKGFYKWAVRNYGVGVFSTAEVFGGVPVLPADISTALQNEGLGASDDIRGISTDLADFRYWAQQWMLANDPANNDTNWTADISDTDSNQITITYEDGSIVSFTAQNFDRQKYYLYVTYRSSITDSAQIYIYQHLSGNALLDSAIAITSEPVSDYFPIIPIREENEFVSGGSEDPLVDTPEAEFSRRACKKLTGTKLSSIVDTLKDNESLEDIDHAHLVLGASLNTKEAAARRYVFEFFDALITPETADSADYAEWLVKQRAHEEAVQDWIDAREAEGLKEPAERGDVPDPAIGRPQSLFSSVRVRPNNTDYEITITWKSLDRSIGNGLGKPDAKKGDIWFEAGVPISYRSYLNGDGEVDDTIDKQDNRVYLYWQKTDTEFRVIEMIGGVHKSYIYAGKYVEIAAADALLDEEITGFIVPLKYSIYANLPLKVATQMTTSCVFLVLSSYEIVKSKWYQSFLFKIFIIMAIITIMYVTGGFGAAGIGVLGANAAVGAVIGLTGVAAVIAGALANAIAAMIITAIITKGATVVFGEKLGAIIGFIASVIAINGLANLANGGTFVVNFGSLTKADTLLRLTNVASSAYSAYVSASVKDIQQDTRDLLEEYEAESERVSDLYAENIGYGNGVIDPMALTEAGYAYVESLDAFLGRTLLTGSDIAELSKELLSNFTEITLSTDLDLD